MHPVLLGSHSSVLATYPLCTLHGPWLVAPCNWVAPMITIHWVPIISGHLITATLSLLVGQTT